MTRGGASVVLKRWNRPGRRGNPCLLRNRKGGTASWLGKIGHERSTPIAAVDEPDPHLSGLRRETHKFSGNPCAQAPPEANDRSRIIYEQYRAFASAIEVRRPSKNRQSSVDGRESDNASRFEVVSHPRKKGSEMLSGQVSLALRKDRVTV
jgi:hypothetical protein